MTSLDRMLGLGKENCPNGDGALQAKGSFNQFFDGLKNEGEEEEKETDNGQASFMTAYRLTGEAKVKGVCDFIETLHENSAKFLVFAHH